MDDNAVGLIAVFFNFAIPIGLLAFAYLGESPWEKICSQKLNCRKSTVSLKKHVLDLNSSAPLV